MKKYLSASVITLGMSMAAAMPAFALTVGTNAAVNADANMNGSANGNVAHSTAASSSSSVTTGASVGVGATTNANTDTNNTQGALGGSITVSTPGQVQSDTDLDAYSMSIQQNDASVSAVSSDDTSVSVDYKVPAKLFGFISLNMTETASVEVGDNNSTEVYVSRPWWSFMAKADDHKDAFASRIKSHLPQNVSASATADARLTASEKAQLISAIQAGAHETFAASGSASASGSAY